MTIPIIFCIDVEPDARLVPREDPPPWTGYEESFTFLNGLRNEIQETTGVPVHYTWLYRLDPQVELCHGTAEWPITHYESFFQTLEEAGDELGLHPHAWRWNDEKNNWVADHANQPFINECLDMSVEAYTRAVGRPPNSLRFGDKFYNEASSRHAESLGLQYDMTPEPGTKPAPAIVTDGSELFTGQLGDFTDMPNTPYRRSETDWKTPDPSRENGMWIIPLSAGLPESTFGRIKRQAKSLIGKSTPAPKPMTLNLNRHVETQMRIADRLLATLERPYIACVIRAYDLAKPDSRMRINGVLRALITHPKASEFQFMRPEEAIVTLEAA